VVNLNPPFFDVFDLAVTYSQLKGEAILKAGCEAVNDLADPTDRSDSSQPNLHVVYRRYKPITTQCTSAHPEGLSSFGNSSQVCILGSRI